MHRLLVRVLAVGITSALASLAQGQAIIGEISVNGGGFSQISGSPFTAGAAISVNVGSVSQETLLRFRTNSSTLVNLGAITVSGTLNDPDKRLSILVATDNHSAFPTIATDYIEESIADCAGITITDPDLRGNTRVAIAATGNLTGGIEVGHVFKLQFNGSGEIQGAVTATAANNSVVTDTGLEDEDTHEPIYAEPMAYVRASKKISGALTATAGDIGIISIGTTAAQTDGLQANVKALAGQIKSIYTAGAIGDSAATPAILPEIWARDRIGEIIATDSEAIDPAILAKDFYADVQSGVGRTSEGDPAPFFDGTLNRIRTDGDFDGVIDAFNIMPTNAQAEGHFGVLVGGTVLCPINVEYMVWGDIIASTFPEPITIGVQLKGSIVATDHEEGIITSVTVGRNLHAA